MLIPKNIFPIARSVSKEASRYMVNGVHVQRLASDKARFEATDGQQLIRIDCPVLQNDSFPAQDGVNFEQVHDFNTIVPAAAWKQAERNIPKSTRFSAPIQSTVLLPENANGSLQLITSNGNSLKTEVNEGQFPNVGAVIPTELAPMKVEYLAKEGHNAPFTNDLYTEITLNAELLASVLETIAKVKADSNIPTVTLHVPLEGTKAMVITAKGIDEEVITALVMPCIE